MGAVYDNLTKNRVPEGGRKNYLINGNFDSWQYGTSQSISGYGSDDRWINLNVGSTKTHSMVNATDTERALFNASKFSRMVVSSVAGASNYVQKVQAIEDVTKLAGKTVTLSFWAKADSNKNIAIAFRQIFGSGGTPSVQVTGIGVQLVALTTAWQKKTLTITLPSIVGKSIGTDGVHTSAVALDIVYECGTTISPSWVNLGQQSGTFDIAEVKIEDGSVATDGWHPYDGEFGGEVQACQRYYEVLGIGTGFVQQSATTMMLLSFSMSKKRVPPSFNLTTTTPYGESPINISARIATGATIGTQMNATTVTNGSILLSVNGFPTMTAGASAAIHSGYVTASAEL